MKILSVQDELSDSNCYIIASHGKALIIDPNHSEKISLILRQYGLTPDYVVLTHEHCDHIQGLEELREQWPVKVIASEACNRGIQSKRENMSSMMEVYLYFKNGERGEYHYPPFTCQPVDIAFKEEMSFSFEGYRLHLKSVPGHTKGSICIFLENPTGEYEGQQILFSGDYFLPGQPVITRLPGGTTAEYEEKGKLFLRNLQPGYLVMPGHGEPYILTEEVKYEYGLL